MLSNVKNIFKVVDLRNKVLFTLAMILLYRFGAALRVPGIDGQAVKQLREASQSQGALGFLNLFSGGAFGSTRSRPRGVSRVCRPALALSLRAFEPALRPGCGRSAGSGVPGLPHHAADLAHAERGRCAHAVRMLLPGAVLGLTPAPSPSAMLCAPDVPIEPVRTPRPVEETH